MTILYALAWTLAGGVLASAFAFCWLEARRRDELDRRMRREIERAAHHVYTNAIKGRRDAA